MFFPFLQSPKQAEQPCIDAFAVLEEMLAQKALLLETSLRQDTGRRRVMGEDVGGDLHQPELIEGVPTQPLHHGGHNAPPQNGFASQ